MPAQAAGGVGTELLWLDDFGQFLSATSYKAKGPDGVEHTYVDHVNFMVIERFLAADPFGLVRQHNFAALDPLLGPFSHDNCAADGYKHYDCWQDCDGYRVEDGYYAILPNPGISNCGRSGDDRDYWDGSDHTGNANGAMLFVNCSMSSRGVVVYEREFNLCADCDNVQLLFSAFVGNASVKPGQEPVRLRLDVRDEDMNLLHQATSGPVASPAAGEKWTNMTFLFPSGGKKKFVIQLVNDDEGGSEQHGNVILLDDLSVSICHPDPVLTASVDSASLLVGNEAVCTIDVANLGWVTARNVDVQVSLPANLRFSTGGSRDSVMRVGHVAPGDANQKKISFSVVAEAPGNAEIHAFVSAFGDETYGSEAVAAAVSARMTTSAAILVKEVLTPPEVVDCQPADLRIEMRSNDAGGRVLPGEKILFTAVSSYGFVQYNWNGTGWTDNAGFEKAFCQDEMLTLSATDGVCPETKVEWPVHVVWPTVFTPYRKDGINDEFLSSKAPGKEERANWKLLVFDHEGRKIYDGQCGWDGTRKGKPVLPGVFFYKVEFPDGTSRRGTVTIVKN